MPTPIHYNGPENLREAWIYELRRDWERWRGKTGAAAGEISSAFVREWDLFNDYIFLNRADAGDRRVQEAVQHIGQSLAHWESKNIPLQQYIAATLLRRSQMPGISPQDFTLVRNALWLMFDDFIRKGVTWHTYDSVRDRMQTEDILRIVLETNTSHLQNILQQESEAPRVVTRFLGLLKQTVKNQAMSVNRMAKTRARIDETGQEDGLFADQPHRGRVGGLPVFMPLAEERFLSENIKKLFALIPEIRGEGQQQALKLFFHRSLQGKSNSYVDLAKELGITSVTFRSNFTRGIESLCRMDRSLMKEIASALPAGNIVEKVLERGRRLR